MDGRVCFSEGVTNITKLLLGRWLGLRDYGLCQAFIYVFCRSLTFMAQGQEWECGGICGGGEITFSG